MPVRGLDLGVDDRVVLVVVLAPLGVPDDHVGAAELGQDRAGDLAGVGAGSCGERSCAPYLSRSLSPSTRVCTRRRSVNGGSTATSTASKSCLASRRVQASFCTRCDGLEVVEVHLPVAGHQRDAADRLGGHQAPVLQHGRGRAAALPSRYSRLAPPPVEMWPNCVVGEAELAHGGGGVAAADDGERARGVTSTSASATRPGARGERRHLEHAHRAVPEHRPRVGELLGEQRAPTPGRCPGPSGRPGSRRRRRPRGRRRRRTRSATTTSTGSTISTPALLGLRRGSPRTVSSWSASSRLLPTSWPWALRKVKTMPPPTSSRSAVPSRLSMTPSLSDTLEPPSTTTYGRSGSSVSRSSTSTSVEHEAAGGVRQPLRRRRRRWPACGARRRTRRRRRRRRARRAASANAPRSASSLLGLARVEPEVLQQRDLAVGRAPATAAWARLARPCRSAKRDRAAEQLAEPRRRPGRASTSASGAPFGPAEVGADDDPRARVGAARSIVGTRRPDPAVVGDRAVAVERHVQVGRGRGRACRAGRPGRRWSSMASARAQSARADVARPGRRGGWSSPTRCRTSRRP